MERIQACIVNQWSFMKQGENWRRNVSIQHTMRCIYWGKKYMKAMLNHSSIFWKVLSSMDWKATSFTKRHMCTCAHTHVHTHMWTHRHIGQAKTLHSSISFTALHESHSSFVIISFTLQLNHHWIPELKNNWPSSSSEQYREGSSRFWKSEKLG
jgi:hypothetical protein